MTETSTATATVDARKARTRLAELLNDRRQLATRQLELQKKVVCGRSTDEMADLASRVIDGAPLAGLVDDYSTQAHRVGQREALPYFEKALSHVARLSKALEAVDAVCKDAAKDLLAFDNASGMTADLWPEKYPDEPKLYDKYKLVPLRGGFPMRDFVEEWAQNASQFDRWRADAQRLGVVPGKAAEAAWRS
jgi:hypothetical protein